MKKPINVGDEVLIEYASINKRLILSRLKVTAIEPNEVHVGAVLLGPEIHFFTRRQVVKVWRKKRKTADEIVEELYGEWLDTAEPCARVAIRKALMMEPPRESK